MILSASIQQIVIQWNLADVDTIRTAVVGLEYRSICLLEASGVFPVGMAVFMLFSTMKPCSRVLTCCMLARKANQRLVLCVPML